MGEREYVGAVVFRSTGASPFVGKTTVHVDGREVKQVRAFEFKASVDSFNTATIELANSPAVIEARARLRVRIGDFEYKLSPVTGENFDPATYGDATALEDEWQKLVKKADT